MVRIWICLVLLSVGAVIAQNYDEFDYDTNEQNDYEDLKPINENLDKDDEHVDIEKPRNDEPFNEYQIEDNRSDLKEEGNKEPELSIKLGEDEKIVSDEDDVKAIADDEAADLGEFKDILLNDNKSELDDSDDGQKYIKELIEEVDALFKDDNENKESDENSKSAEISIGVNKDLEPLPLPPAADGNSDELRKIFEDTMEILSQDNDNDFGDDAVETNNQSNIDDVIEEANNILADLDDTFNDQEINEEAAKDADVALEEKKEPDSNVDKEESDVEKAYKDLNEDLDSLMDTWKKLSDDENKQENPDDTVDPEKVADYEEKYGRPYKEGVILAQRDDYYDYDNDKNDDETDVKINDDDINDEVENNLDENNKKDEVMENVKVENINDAIGKEARDYNEMSDDDNSDAIYDDIDIHLEDDVVEDGDVEEENVENEKKSEDIFGAMASRLRDDLDDEQKDSDDNLVEAKEEEVESSVENKEEVSYVKEGIPAQEEKKEDAKTIDVADLTPEQYSTLMEQFKVLHADELDTQSSNFERNVAVDHINLSVDEPAVVTSPNYPLPYPINNVVDWIFEGDGVGIELNITDFFVNGVMGHYLLIKPGGVDATGNDGLIFSYRLDQPRRYRFLDVDRMFVRFASPGGMPFMRGFQMSARMISPPLQFEETVIEPEPIVREPTEFLTLYLGHLKPREFHDIQEDFRVLVADMATMYINSNEIDHGINTTFEVTRITSLSSCNINWPNHESCTEVKIAVPLVYDDDETDDDPRLNEDDLRAMWYAYSEVDPFALRLRRMGISEFTIPNDGSVLTVWLVISAGMIISMVMLAFALWRYSCYENYSRMPEWVSPEEEGGKRPLGLYPTPHQALPPLYSHSRDLDGFNNKSFAQDELYDIESDEEGIPARDRKLVFTTQDSYTA